MNNWTAGNNWKALSAVDVQIATTATAVFSKFLGCIFMLVTSILYLAVLNARGSSFQFALLLVELL